MKNIINWTLGGFFRSIGRILSFLVIGLLIGLIVAKTGFKLPSWLSIFDIVYADTVNYSYNQYRVQYYSLSTGTTVWNTYQSFNTSTPLSNGYGVSVIATRFGWSQKFKTGITYRVTIEGGASPSSTINETFLNISNIGCYGSTSTGNWSNDSSLIESCSVIGVSRVTGSNHFKWLIDITPTSDIIGIQINVYLSGTSEVSSVNVYNKSTIFYGDSPTSAIEEQTTIIQEEFNSITNIINQNNEDLINAITEDNEVCKTRYINNKIEKIQDGGLTQTGNISLTSNYYLSTYFRINENSKLKVLLNQNTYSCFYTENQTLISCFMPTLQNMGTFISIPSNAKYVRFTIQKNNANNIFELSVCDKGNQSLTDSIDDLNGTLHNTDTDVESNDLGSFFSDFTLSIEGPVSQIVLLPLDLLNVLIVDYNSSDSHADICTTFKGQRLCLPSGDILWQRSGCHDNFASPWFPCTNLTPLKNFLQLVVGGFIIYKLLRRLVASVEKGLDPSSTRVDMMKL